MPSTRMPDSFFLSMAIFTVSVVFADSLPSFTASSRPSTVTLTRPAGTFLRVFSSSSLRSMVSRPARVCRSSSGVTVMVVSLPLAVLASEALM